ncbi:MAG TPA: ATP-binding protein [Vicinamibacterales bacterium]|nr:ATP-binding protein [Vicinamibacterales bacterium]
MRLTLWYSGVLAISLALLGVAAWFGIQASLYRAIDSDLLDRVRGVHQFLEHELVGRPTEEMRDDFAEHGSGDALQIRDDRGSWIYRAPRAIAAGTPLEPLAMGAPPRLARIVISGLPFRSVTAIATVDRRAYTFQIVEPLGDIEAALRQVRRLIVTALPLVLIIASAGGYAISRRALAPVDALTSSARAISAYNLSQRVPRPDTGDELERLSATLNEMLHRLETAFHRTRQFTADASHELRTPVAFMRTVAEVLLRQPRTDQEWRTGVADIHGELIRTTTLIEDLMTVARADGHAEPRTFSRLDLLGPLDAAVHRARALGAERAVGVDYAEALAVFLDGDASLLERLFAILLDNAVKYTPAGGQVTVSLISADGAAVVEVRDTGIGIAPEDLPHVFERFYRSDKARARETGGAGLGLAIARWIAEVHDATLTVDSELGRGAVFCVDFSRRTRPDRFA